MQIRMNRTAKGSPDGFTVCEYKQGETYDVPEDLGYALIASADADPEEAHAEADKAEAEKADADVKAKSKAKVKG